MLKKLSLLFTIFLCLLSLPGFGQEEDDELLRDLEQQRQKQIELANKLNAAKINPAASTFDAMEELKILGHKSLNVAALSDEKALKVIKKLMEQGSLGKASPEDVKKLLLDKVNPGAQKFLNEHPKILDTAVDLLRDSKALPSLIDILIRKSDLKLYAVIWIGLIILGWLLKKIIFKPDWNLKKKMAIGFIINISITAISLATFYNLFKQELIPTISIISKHWDKD